MGKTILLVDDAAIMRTMLKDILSKNGYEIVGEAENGKSAIEQYKALLPKLVIMDISMPEMNGIDAIKSIKDFDKDAVVIMCLAMGQQDMITESIKAGARDFLVKPFQQDRVLLAVQKAIG